MKSLFKRSNNDDEYDRVKEEFKMVIAHHRELASRLKDYIRGIQKMSEMTTKLCEDANCAFRYAPIESKDQAVKFARFSRTLDVQIFNYYIPELQDITLTKLVKMEQQVDSIFETDENRKKALKAYESIKKDKKAKSEDIEECHQKYEQLTQTFITSAKKFIETRASNLDAVYADFILAHQKLIINLNDSMEPFNSVAPTDEIAKTQKNVNPFA